MPPGEIANAPASSTAREGPSSSGLTSRVLRGGVFSVAGQVAVLAASLIATPIVIRGVGTEAYGVLALVTIVLGYLSFADFGMGTASTVFGARAHAAGDDDGERAVVLTALLIASSTAAAFAVALALVAPILTKRVLEVPDALRDATTLAIQFAALGFFVRSVANVLNTPQLVRLRMDLYTCVSTAGSLLQILLVPAAIVLGYGLAGAVTGVVVASVALAAMHFVVSNRLLPGMLLGRPSAALARRFMRFGSGLVVSSVASVTLTNGEKLLLTHYASVRELAYYTVAFTVAALLAIAPQAVGQLLLPAFSQLHGAGDRSRTRVLFDRALRGGFLYSAPVVIAICILGRPFLALWAGPEFAQGGGSALTVLALGYGVNVLAFVPYFVLVASGRSDLVARIHVAELVPYLLLAAALIARYGATGAGLAWSIRALADAVAMFWFARREAGVSPTGLLQRWPGLAAALAALAVPAVVAAISGPIAAVVAAVVALPAYAIASFIWVLDGTERDGVLAYGRRARALTRLAPRR